MREKAGEIAAFVMLQVATWVRGTALQGERVLATRTTPSGTQQHDRAVAVIEEEFFVLSARKLVRWIGAAEAQKLIPGSTFEAVHNLKRAVIDVRDIREHADQYIVYRKAKKQSEFHFAPKERTGRIKYSSDATATIVLDGQYLIAWRLSVQSVLAAVAEGRDAFLRIISNDEQFRWITSVLA